MHFNFIMALKQILIFNFCMKYDHVLVKLCKICSLLTRDGDFGRPLGRPLQHGLFGCLQLGDEVFLREQKHLLNQLEHLGSVLLPDFHPFLHGHDDVLGFVLGSMFRALLYCTYRGRWDLHVILHNLLWWCIISAGFWKFACICACFMSQYFSLKKKKHLEKCMILIAIFSCIKLARDVRSLLKVY